MKKGAILKKRYRIQREIGRDAGAVTYLAVERTTGRQCIVKRLSFAGTEDLKTVERFRREAKLLANLNHPYIPDFIDYYEEETESDIHIYLIQEYIAGKNLNELIRGGKRFTEKEAIDMAIQLCSILEYLHGFSPSVIHRDIKPSNILIGKEDAAFLIDFGAVRDNLRHAIDMDAMDVGTHGYMSPEQIRGQSIPTSDIYSLGIALVHILSHLEPSEIPQKDFKPDFRPYVNISGGFAEIIGRMIEPDAGNLYRTAAELRDDLLDLLKTGTTKRKPLRIRWVAMALLAAAAVAGLWFSFQTRDAPIVKTKVRPQVRTRPAAPAVKPVSPAVPKAAEKKKRVVDTVRIDPPKIHLAFDGNLEGKGIRSTHIPGDDGELTFTPGKRKQGVWLADATIEFVEEKEIQDLFAGSYTLAFWFRLNGESLAEARYIPVARSAVFTLDVRKGRKVILFIHGEQGGHFQINLYDKDGLFRPGSWQHLTIVRYASRDEFVVYLNGRPIARRKSPFPTARLLDVLKLGTGAPKQDHSFRLEIDEFVVYDYSRTAQQVATDAMAEATVKMNTVHGRLLFNARPITEFTDAGATIWLRNEALHKKHEAEVKCHKGQFQIGNLPAGRYGMGVRIRTGSGGYDGHFTAWKTFNVTDNVSGHVSGPMLGGDASGEVIVHLARILHMTSPQDNSRRMARWGARCEGKMSFPSPVLFEWKPVVPGAVYHYSIERYRCEPFKTLELAIGGETTDTRLSIELPSSMKNEMYLFRLLAKNGNLLVGKLETYGKTGGRGWDYRFRVE